MSSPARRFRCLVSRIRSGSARGRSITFLTPNESMDFKEWFEVAGKVAFPILALIAIAWFWQKSMWPFLVKRIERQDADSEKFLAALKQLGETHEETTKEIVQALHALRDEVRRR